MKITNGLLNEVNQIVGRDFTNIALGNLIMAVDEAADTNWSSFKNG
jgi:hypothetical protein